MEFKEGKYIKVLPKCSHIFHEECIEKWILKVKYNMICCPVCRTNIKQEIEIQEQVDSLGEEDSEILDENSKHLDLENGSINPSNNNLLNMTESPTQNNTKITHN